MHDSCLPRTPRSDADLVKFVEQRKEMNLLVGEWKKSELLRETVEQESKQLKKALRSVSSSPRALVLLSGLTRPRARSSMENDLAEARRAAVASGAAGIAGPSGTRNELVQLRHEMERLRVRNLELEERLADVLDDEDADVLAAEDDAEDTGGEAPVASSHER